MPDPRWITCPDCEEIEGAIVPCKNHRPDNDPRMTNFERRLREEHSHLPDELVNEIVDQQLAYTEETGAAI